MMGTLMCRTHESGHLRVKNQKGTGRMAPARSDHINGLYICPMPNIRAGPIKPLSNEVSTMAGIQREARAYHVIDAEK